ncbi:hypothetical protein PHLGIDRAFT_128645 [Phlebiopsis gigantea 11061_1 CR5-6]|uniref:Uncharacterized protein n=1 Tax=Phlebiopsis gigantea (strain 11061_1 CR5-6) TaxID=745531 RepID=A0A0C3PII9_PHLG1|nr:hypothetical protein PHLGIDRAFT_128645 [Phlebiopsis gigantea 11061_1 CR5-6]
MSEPSYFDTLDSPPPPAYEFSQQEFDQKVSHALEVSRAEPQRAGEAEEEWEVWDEAVFATAVARLAVSETATSPGASSSRSPADAPASGAALVPSAQAQQPPAQVGNGKGRVDRAPGFGASPDHVQPLRIVKKSTQAPLAQSGKKERPSWLEEAQLGGPPAPPAHRAAVDRPAVYRNDSVRSIQSSTPPPEFTPVGPSLDGPPYEGPPQPSGIVLTYVPGDSRPNSPLHSPVEARAPLPYRSLSPSQFSPPQPRNSIRRSLPPPPGPRAYSSSPGPQNRNVHQSLPSPPRIPPQPSPRPAASYGLKQGYGVVTPRVAFDPRVAYANEKTSFFDLASEEPQPQKVDAASLYSSAVSSLYTSSVSAPPPPPPLRPHYATPSINLSPYSNFSASQSHSSYHLPQPAAPAASSYSLHQPLIRESAASPAPSEMSAISRQSVHSTHSQHTATRPGYPSQQLQSGYHPGTGYQSTSYPSQAQTAYPAQPSYQHQQRPHYQSASYQSSYQPTSY